LVTFGNRAFDSTSYLPLSGGTLTTSSNTNILNLDGSAGSEVGIRFLRSGNVRGWMGYMDGGYMYMYNAQRGNYLRYNDDGTLTFENYTVWHAGNDGSGSGLDADTLDGYHAGVQNGQVSIFVSFPGRETMISQGFLTS
jgi:hypothetical protein